MVVAYGPLALCLYFNSILDPYKICKFTVVWHPTKLQGQGLVPCSFYLRNDWTFYIVKFAGVQCRVFSFFPFKKGSYLSV